MKNKYPRLKVALHRTKRFLRTYKEPIFYGLGCMIFISILGLAIDPDRAYKSDLVENYLRIQTLERNIDAWQENVEDLEEKILEAEKELAERNRKDLLLSELIK